MYAIPANATLVRYLEIAGDGSYIDTGIVPQGNPSAVIKAQYLGTSLSGSQSTPLFGCKNSSTSKAFAFWVDSSDDTLDINYGSTDTSSDSSIVTSTDESYFYDFGVLSTGAVYDKDMFVEFEGSIENEIGTSCCIGALKQSNGTITTNGVRILVASFQLYNDGVLVWDGVPVKVNSVAYMFDRVNGQLFGNAGTGIFGMGSDVHSVFSPVLKVISGGRILASRITGSLNGTMKPVLMHYGQ